MVFSIGDVKTLLGSFVESSTREIKDMRVGFFEMLAAGKNRRVDQLGKWRLGPQDRNLNRTIAEKADFVAAPLQCSHCSYRISFGLERTPDLVQANFDRFAQLFVCGLNADGRANVFYSRFDGLKCAVDTQIGRFAPELKKLLSRRIYGGGKIRGHWSGRCHEIVNQCAEKIENDGPNRHASTRSPRNPVVVLLSGCIINRTRYIFGMRKVLLIIAQPLMKKSSENGCQ